MFFGPMMFGGAWIMFWLFVVVVVLPLVVFRRYRHWGRDLRWGPDRRFGPGWRQDEDWRPEQRQRPQSPEAILDERFARGEITKADYQEALIEILKARYVRSELTIEDYETRLSVLMGGRPGAGNAQRAPSAQLGEHGEDRPAA